MKFSTLALALCASVLAACSQGKPKIPPPPAVGFWEGEMTTSGSDFNQSASIPAYRIDKDSVAFTNHCSDGNGDKVLALTATSPARITDNKIIIERTDVKTAPSGNIACEARVDKGEYPYEIVDGKMIVTLSGGAKISFKRVTGPKAAPAEKKIDYSQAGDQYAPGFSFPPL